MIIECLTFMSSSSRDFMKVDRAKKYWNWRYNIQKVGKLWEVKKE